MRESYIERRLVEGVKLKGGLAWKFVSPGMSGVPDRIVLMPGGKVIFVELKTDCGVLSRLQVRVQNILQNHGFKVVTLYGIDEVEDFVDAL